MDWLKIELLAFWSALVGYALATALSSWAMVFRKRPERSLYVLIALSWGMHTLAIAARWARLGHLPFINMFEMLSANVWGLMTAVLVGYAILPRLRVFAAFVLPIVMLLVAWLLLTQREDSALPPTYHTVWLFIHIAFVKLFLGCAFVALGIAGIVLARAVGWRNPFTRLPEDEALDATAHRAMALALIFDTLAISAGAIWARDAWGRYWSWDSLEVWSLITWLSIGLMLHLRASYKTGPRLNALMVIAVFVIAFFTFFGVPFVSEALHKGMI